MWGHPTSRQRACRLLHSRFFGTLHTIRCSKASVTDYGGKSYVVLRCLVVEEVTFSRFVSVRLSKRKSA
jgi:hypothetical protein